ncbi:MAG: 50S ribosomal protein L14e [Candidatus Micrarchaeia archaeon]
MPIVEQGRVCVKKYGRDAGDKAVIVKAIDENFVSIVTSSRPKPRKCNISHLELLAETVQLNKEEVAKALEIPADKLKL